MPAWIPTPEWAGQDAVIVGGGSSLSKFDFTKICGRNTIGCNDAFRLGRELVKICLFGDVSWFNCNKQLLEHFPGRVVCLAPSLRHLSISWLFTMGRQRSGLHKGGDLGWNFSTGAAAVNLAISLGAVRIFLLGFDMQSDVKTTRAHWHHYNEKPVKDFSFRRFITGFAVIQQELSRFPGVKVFNVTEGALSKLPFFPKMTFDTFYKYIPPHRREPCEKCEERKRLAQEIAA